MPGHTTPLDSIMIPMMRTQPGVSVPSMLFSLLFFFLMERRLFWGFLDEIKGHGDPQTFWFWLMCEMTPLV